MSPHNSFVFLHLTRELRDYVYEFILLSSLKPPLSPEHAGGREHPEVKGRSCEECNQYPTESLVNPTLSLQLTCRQIKEEVYNAIHRLKSQGSLHYRLDCMMLNENKLYPTWLSYPAMIDEIPKLSVTFRLFRDGEERQSAWRSRCVGPPEMVWSLYFLMKRFLMRGPDFLSSIKRDRKIMVQELAVDVETPSSPPPNGYDDGRGNIHDRLRKYHLHPRRIVEIMTRYMDDLLRRTGFTAPYATSVFERVERMTFTLDGVEQHSWVLSTMEPEWTP